MKSLFPESIKRMWRSACGTYGALRYGNPAKKLTIIGVTGTSGKSTVSAMIFHVLKEAGLSVGLISTVGAKVNDISIDTGLHVTTPDPIQLEKLLKTMVDNGAEYVVLESSSHALAQRRIAPVTYDYAIYTNIKRDHLDWHKTWEAYALAKARMISLLRAGGKIIANRDDDSFSFINQFAKKSKQDEHLISYAKRELSNSVASARGIAFTYKGVSFSIPVIGDYNIENALATITVCEQIGLSTDKIAQSFQNFAGLRGRMQIMQEDPFVVIVDFAHNTDSLERSLINARELVQDDGKVICVFGSGGLRDIEKRFTMGEVSGRLADVTVITAEDPRTESLLDINTNIIEGAKQAGAELRQRFANRSEYQQYVANTQIKEHGQSIYAFDEESVQSRYDAIDFAVRIAEPGDVVITEGKGHELSLAFGKEEFPFTDQEAVRQAIESSSNVAKPEKTIKFTPELTELVKTGEKTKTFRLRDDKFLKTGDRVLFATRDGQEVTEFGEGKLVAVTEKKLKDLNKKDYEGNEQVTDPVEHYKKYYGDDVTEDELVKVIEFKVTKLYE